MLIEVNDAKCARTGVALNPWQPQNACGNSGNVKIGARSFTFCVLKVERLSGEVALPTSWMLINLFKCACHYLFQLYSDHQTLVYTSVQLFDSVYVCHVFFCSVIELHRFYVPTCLLACSRGYVFTQVLKRYLFSGHRSIA